MKRDMDKLNLRDAFSPEPEACHEALMRAACSVKEEQQVKRVSFRAILIAAILVILTSVAALAAGNMLGWTDFFQSRTNYGVPQAALDEMKVDESVRWEVGPLTFTLNELMADPQFAMSSIHISTTDGAKALLTGEPYDCIGASGKEGDAMAASLGVSPDMTWIEAAEQLNLPLYSVRAILEISGEYAVGDAMEYTMWNDDGSVTYLSQPSLIDAPTGELPVAFFLRVAQIDPTTEDETDKWIDREQTATVAIGELLEEKTMNPAAHADFAGFELQEVQLQRYITGVYLKATFTAAADMTEEDAYKLYEMKICDQRGNPLPHGMSMTGSIDTSAWPQIVWTDMIGVEAIPESIMLALPQTITVK